MKTLFLVAILLLTTGCGKRYSLPTQTIDTTIIPKATCKEVL